jgi:hypothetical protein
MSVRIWTINKAAVRKTLLALADAHRRPAGFTRVSEALLEKIDTDLHNKLRRIIECHPSIGKTLKEG